MRYVGPDGAGAAADHGVTADVRGAREAFADDADQGFPRSDGSADVPDGGVKVVLEAIADAYLTSDLPGDTHGDAPWLRIDGDPVWRSMVRFDLSGLPKAASIRRVVLNVYAETRGVAGYDVYAVGPADPWDEATVSWSNAPPPGTLVGGAAPWEGARWTAADVSAVAPDPPTVELMLTTTDVTQVRFSSREGAAPPTLELSLD